MSRSICPVAEAPCKQTAQVGESMSRTRTEDEELLKLDFNDVTSPDEKLTRAG